MSTNHHRALLPTAVPEHERAPDTATLSDALLDEARGWIADCVWADLEPDDVPALSDQQVRAAIERHYDGGCPSFAAASPNRTTQEG